MKSTSRIREILIFILTAICIGGVYLINSGQTALRQTGDVAGQEETINYTLPPGYVFSIWGLIYLGFIMYATYGLTRSGASDPHMKATALPFTISLLLNLAWTVIVGADEWGWAYPVQWIMLVVAIWLFFKWDMGQRPLSRTQKWMSIPFALYAGWVTVAMIPFTASLLNQWGWDGGPFSRETWGIILYVLAALIVFLAYLRLRHPFYLLPLPWALIGFYVRFEENFNIKTAALLTAAVVLGFALRKCYGYFKIPVNTYPKEVNQTA